MGNNCGPPMCKLCLEAHPLGQHTKFGGKAKAVALMKAIEAKPKVTLGSKGKAKKAALKKKKGK